MSTHNSNHFPTTAWSMVHAAKKDESSDYYAAMNRFIARYWRPVFYFLRTKGYPLEQSEDLTQEFFLRFLERDWISRADPQRGRFRTFLLTILVRFLSDRGSLRAPKQEGFDGSLVSISTLVDENERSFEPPVNEPPEKVFMKRWAQAVLASVEQRVANWCQDEGRPDWNRIFQAIHFPPAGETRPSQQQLAIRLRQTRDQIRYGLEQANNQFVRFLREEVTDQVEADADIEEEIRELQELLAS